jgi:hypothetical protein
MGKHPQCECIRRFLRNPNSHAFTDDCSLLSFLMHIEECEDCKKIYLHICDNDLKKLRSINSKILTQIEFTKLNL